MRVKIIQSQMTQPIDQEIYISRIDESISGGEWLKLPSYPTDEPFYSWVKRRLIKYALGVRYSAQVRRVWFGDRNGRSNDTHIPFNATMQSCWEQLTTPETYLWVEVIPHYWMMYQPKRYAPSGISPGMSRGPAVLMHCLDRNRYLRLFCPRSCDGMIIEDRYIDGKVIATKCPCGTGVYLPIGGKIDYHGDYF